VRGKRGERGARLRMRLEMEVLSINDDRTALSPFDPGCLQRKVQRGAGHLPEILIILQEAAQPAVFELLSAARPLGDQLTLSRAQFLGFREHRMGVVESAVGVKDQARTVMSRSS